MDDAEYRHQYDRCQAYAHTKTKIHNLEALKKDIGHVSINVTQVQDALYETDSYSEDLKRQVGGFEGIERTAKDMLERKLEEQLEALNRRLKTI